jgi:hypothetical protein
MFILCLGNIKYACGNILLSKSESRHLGKNKKLLHQQRIIISRKFFEYLVSPTEHLILC